MFNGTLGVALAAQARVADGAWARFRGLMFAGPLAAGEGLIIRPCGSIHMMFMRFAIDAVFFDGDLRVTKVARRVRPWVGVAIGGRGAKGVVELPRGGAGATERGHLLQFRDSAARG